MAGILFIISAPSGSGKSTLVGEVRKQLTEIDFSVSWTTRPPRGSEQNGREYNFTSREEFEKMIAAGEFLEPAIHGRPVVSRRHGCGSVFQSADLSFQGKV